MTTPASAAGTPAPPRSRSRGALVLARFARNRLALVGIALVVALVVLAYAVPPFLHWTYHDNDFTSLDTGPGAAHWFGTTHSGQDLFALTLRGLQKSLVVGLVGGPLTTLIAAVVGASAGYFGGWTDRVLMWFLDLMLVIPAFLLLAVLSPAFQHGTWLFFVILLAAFGWMITGRVVRSMTQTLREREYVLAARYMGVHPLVVIFRHILPNAASILIIDATVQVGAIVLGETSLSYFGFGIQAPDVSLGTLIAAGTPDANTSPWLFFFPAAFLVLIGLAVAFIGDGLRDAFDPTARGAKSRRRARPAVPRSRHARTARIPRRKPTAAVVPSAATQEGVTP
ncbi:ABC transporter permease [Actinacidiphila glaucinigra]|uniref:ABC transporter permease n=1 Tax=Actinacidiphila glaucinigra TaxID=235986 RepID=UPI003868B357